MTKNEHLLTRLSEECNETAQRVSKALVFGLTEIQPGQSLSNAERIVYEFNDIVGLMELLQEAGCVDKVIDRTAIELKKAKVKKYMDYSNECGTVSLKQIKSGEMFECDGKKYIIKSNENSSDRSNLENGQNIFILSEI